MKKHGYLLVALLLITALLATVMAGCGGGKPAETPKSKGPQGTVMIYTSIYPDIIELIKPEMKKQFPDLDVQWFQAGTEKVMAKIAGEIEAKKVQADLIMVADPSYYLTLKDQNLLLKYDSPNRKDIVANKDTEGYWTGVRISNMIIAYNTAKVSEADAPKSFKDLLEPKWNGKIAMPSPLLSGTAYVAAGVLSDKYGWEYFEQLRQNGMKVEEGNSALQNKLVRGEYHAVMILEENILKIGAKGEPVKVVYPADGTIIIPSPIAILNSSKNQEAAKAVLDWFLTKQGQEVIVKGWMHSVRDDVNPPQGAPALKTFAENAAKPDWAKLAKDNETVKETFRSKVLDK
ncbi:ABC transporter substrate-binding protein [Acetonema longum]|uniref:Extracellular solute-binding protein family 1 n=1 Tax=Acetonema longum DSM 6540 TaxID=1009370 RepID=F7NQF7_9FIRM|nr:ABC transporter substrate-binding protein [Acetonema longum]EGO61735.1 extracellular solute-binding protein family 1 [Acetonema longum DSM 6540]